MQLLLGLYLAVSVLLIGVALPLTQRRIKPNSWYGFRVPQTLNNPRVWYEANAYTGRLLIWAGVLSLVAAILFYGVPGIDVDRYALGVAGVTVGSLVVVLVRSWRYLQTINR